MKIFRNLIYTFKPRRTNRIQQRYPNDQQDKNIINYFSHNNDPFKSEWKQEKQYSHGYNESKKAARLATFYGTMFPPRHLEITKSASFPSNVRW